MGAGRESAGRVYSQPDRRALRRERQRAHRRDSAAEGVQAPLSYVHPAAVAGADDGSGNAAVQHVHDLQGRLSGVDVLCVRAAGMLDHLHRFYQPLVGHSVAGRVRFGADLDAGAEPVSVVRTGKRIAHFPRLRGAAGADASLGRASAKFLQRSRGLPDGETKPVSRSE